MYCNSIVIYSTLDYILHNLTVSHCVHHFVSHSGLNRESWAVDYGGGLNMLQSLELTLKQNELNGTKHNGQKTKKQKSQFVLLSAFCCGKPVLQFQFAKIKLEEEIRKVSGITEGLTHSIVRPTAYFKSLDGQIESAKRGTYVRTSVLTCFFQKGEIRENFNVLYVVCNVSFQVFQFLKIEKVLENGSKKDRGRE